MLLSTEPLGRRFRARANGAWLAMVLALGAFAGLHGLTLGYHLRVFRGETVVGRYVSSQTWTTTDDDGDPIHHRALSVRLPDGPVFTGETSTLGPAGDAYVRYVPSRPSASSFGRHPSLHVLLLAAHLLLPILCFAVFRWLTPKRWYEGRKQRTTGTGRLPEGDGRP